MRTPKTKTTGSRKVSRQKKLLPKVAGGKALARIHLYQLQREPEVKSVSRKISKPVMSRIVDQKTKRNSTQPQSRSRSLTAGSSAKSYYVAAFDAIKQMNSPSLTRGLAAASTPPTWRPIGPFSIPHGQTYGSGPSSRPSVAGRVSSVAIDPTDPTHVLIGAAGGGVWESHNRGETWFPRGDFQPSLSIGAVKFDPTDPNIAYAGTGEGDSRAYDLAAGLLRSTNGGTDWEVHATDPFDDNEAFFDLLIDETDGDHLLAACTGGLYRSTDGGVSWDRERPDMTFSLSMTIKFDGTREFLAATERGLYRSTTGATWSKVTISGAPTTFDRLEVAHAPSDGSIVVVSGAKNDNGFLWRRASFGSPFSGVAMPTDINVGQAWYDWFAAIAPNNPDVIYLGAVDMYRGVRNFSGNWDWENISAKSFGDCIHPDQHAIAFNPLDGNDLIVGNDGGVFRSTDGGTTWVSLNKGLNITEFEYLAQHPEHEGWMIGGTQDNGTLRYQNQQVWYLVQDGDGGDCGVDNSRPKTCYHSFYGMYLERSNKGGEWNSWTNTGLPASTNDEGLFYPPVEVNGQRCRQSQQHSLRFAQSRNT